MPTAYRIDPADRLILLTGTGALADDELFGITRAAHEDAAFDPGYRLLVDFSQADLTGVSAPAVRALGAESRVKARRAIVVPQGFAYGLARMYAAYTQPVAGEDVRVFTDADVARGWVLGVADRASDGS